MLQGMTWKEIFTDLVKDFAAWGCRYSKKKLPEIAMGYDCTPLFFWNWLDDPEVEKSETGFLRVLGYAWRKHLQELSVSDGRAAGEVHAGNASLATGARVPEARLNGERMRGSQEEDLPLPKAAEGMPAAKAGRKAA